MDIFARVTFLVLFQVLVFIAAGGSESGEDPDYLQIRELAEAYFVKGSFQLALEEYTKARELDLEVDQARWVEFRIADTKWRSFAASPRTDESPLLDARELLGDLLEELEEVKGERPLLWAQISESLGDSWWLSRRHRNWGQAWPYYQQALDWWAGSKEIEEARARYLGIIWRVSHPPEIGRLYSSGYLENFLPLSVVENAVRISEEAEDRAHAHYLMAETLWRQGGSRQQMSRVGEEFEEALKAGPEAEWYDDALFHYADWAAQYGDSYSDGNGDLVLRPDYEEALGLYGTLLSQFRKGETRYYGAAQNAVKRISQPQLSVHVSNVFLPGSEVRIHLNWRNIDDVEIDLYGINLVDDVRFSRKDYGLWQWLEAITTDGREPWKTISQEARPKMAHYPVSEEVHLDFEIPTGAYLVEARGGGSKARDILLVSDAALILRNSHSEVLSYFAESVTGAPIEEATVVVWERFNAGFNAGGKWRWKQWVDSTDSDGMTQFQFPSSRGSRQFFASAVLGERQAFALLSSSSGYDRYDGDRWRAYVYTDRPAYRPDETVHWKVIARHEDEAGYRVPADAIIHYAIYSPRGEVVDEGDLRLNAFGSAWGDLDLSAEMALGAYSITFSRNEKRESVESAVLFHMEEYKLPEFKVEIELGGEDFDRDIFRIGNIVTGSVQADYYFGGAVADAEVEIVVYERPFYHWYRPEREYPWLYGDEHRPHLGFYGGRGSEIKREILRTDSTGAAKFIFETPSYSEQDFEYTVEARVVDSSRREIVSKRNLRVTRQGYYVYLEPEHRVLKPGDRAEIRICAMDANNRPLSVEGRLRLTMERWKEIWIDQRGRQISGEQMKELRKKSGRRFAFGAMPEDYRLKKEGYEVEEIEVSHLQTGEDGAGVYRFGVPKSGYFRIAWLSRDSNGQPIKTDTAVWAVEEGDIDLGYRPGAVSIVVDRDTFRLGQRAPIMISTPASGRYVLFSVGAEELLSYELIRVEGRVKLHYLKVDEKHVPNSFLNAAMVAENQLFVDQVEIVVPPTENSLNVEVSSQSQGYQPQEEGVYEVRVTDDRGRPVSAEVSFALVDEAVYYIQPELAGDIRQFFYGKKRANTVQTSSTFAQKPYFRLEPKNEDEAGIAKTTGVEGVSMDEGVMEAVPAMDRQVIYLGIGGRRESVESEQFEMEKVALSMAFREEAADGRSAIVRTDFRNTIVWQPDIVTDEEGKAEISVKFPDSLTSWRATARGVALKSRFGGGKSSVQTRLPLIARLQGPRFFVVGDKVLVSGVYNNNTEAPMEVQASLGVGKRLEIEGILGSDGQLKGSKSPVVTIPPNDEARVDWQVSIRSAGEVTIKLAGREGDFADAMEKSFQVYEHGIQKFVGKSGKVRGDSVTVTFDIPAKRKKESTQLEVQVTPSLAVTLLDALPFLIDYPYGCTEQTMSRFLPAAIVAKTLRDMGLEKEDIAGKVFGGIEVEHTQKTQPKRRRDLGELDAIVQSGLKRLYDFQHGSGAWGWWEKGSDDLFMTAYVVWGLTLAEDAGIDVDANVLRRSRSFLEKSLVEAELNYDLQAWMLHALSSRNLSVKEKRPERFEANAFLNLMKNRSRLNAYTRALLAIAAQNYGLEEDAKLLIGNLRNGVQMDRKPDKSILLTDSNGANAGVIPTAHWGEEGAFWRWSEGGVEATAFAFMALLEADPDDDLIEPVMNWLVKNRRGAQWSNTRDTAITVLALNRYLEESGEMDAVLEYELLANGKLIASTDVTLSNVLEAPSVYPIDREMVRDGENTVEIRRKSGEGPIYFSVNTAYFSLEEPITAEGSEVFVKRDYYRIKAVPTLLKGFVEEKVLLGEREGLKSGERIEVVLTVEGKNDLEYLVLEDLKPAGFEAVQLQSGEPLYARELREAEATLDGSASEEVSAFLDGGYRFTGKQQWVYQELRDRHVAFFVDRLPEGFWEIRYLLRAEVPGDFHALPLMGSAMYVPEIRANGREARVRIGD